MLPGAIELLRSVYGTYELGLITNGLKEVQRPRLKRCGFEDYFNFVVVSDEIGVAKPSAAFFDVAYEQMNGVDKSKVLVIGDNHNADVRGALEYGFDACWLRHPGAIDRPHLNETYRIRDIRDLADVLALD